MKYRDIGKNLEMAAIRCFATQLTKKGRPLSRDLSWKRSAASTPSQMTANLTISKQILTLSDNSTQMRAHSTA